MKYSKNKLLNCVQRELNKRKEVYPKLIANQKMAQADADLQVDMMLEVFKFLDENYPE